MTIKILREVLLRARSQYWRAADKKSMSLSRTSPIEEITPESIDNFSTSAYQPMEGLLARQDFASLSSQPGLSLSHYRDLRRERLRAFRQYLIRLVSDFNLLHLTARGVIAVGAEDRSDLFSKLIWLKLRFWMALIRAEATYLSFRFGL